MTRIAWRASATNKYSEMEWLESGWIIRLSTTAMYGCRCQECIGIMCSALRYCAVFYDLCAKCFRDAQICCLAGAKTQTPTLRVAPSHMQLFNASRFDFNNRSLRPSQSFIPRLVHQSKKQQQQPWQLPFLENVREEQ